MIELSLGMKFDRAKFKRIAKKTIAIFFILFLVYNLLYILVIPNRVIISSINSSSDTLIVLTYNVEYGLSDSILQKLMQSNADIIALQEATSFENNVSEIQISDVAELLDMNYLLPDNGYISKYGLVILTKYNITTVTAMEYEYQRGSFPRSLLILQIETPFGKIDVMNTHLSFPAYMSTRYRQIKEIIENIDNTTPTLLLGDFNTPASLLDPSYWLLSSKFSDGYIAAGGNVYTGRTWHRNIELMRVDYVWLSNHWEVIKETYQFIEANDSDHLGFSLEISIS